MKKLLALVLALAMMLCMGTAFATGESAAPAEKETVPEFLTKTWSGEEKCPTEALSFDVTKAEAAEDAESAVTVNTIALAMAEGGNTFTLTHDKLQPGTYYFTVKEHDNGNAGVTYDKTEYVVEILAKYVVDANGVPTEDIEYDYEVSKAADAKAKIDGITNTYADGEVTVKKVVTGNLANKNDTFGVTVTFTSKKPVNMDITIADDADADTEGKTVAATDWTGSEGTYTATATMTVKAADTNGYTISGIPADVKVSVEETDKGLYTLKKIDGNDAVVADDSTATITITNEYTTDIQTGINMDSMPYIVLMGLVVLAGVALILKKRTVND